MKTLVIIPSLIHKYTFSAPLAWLLTPVKDHVEGTYSYKLKKKDVKNYDLFIVELNWFIELYEFSLIVKFIKRHNSKAKILFGGQYAQIMYKEIFKRYPVDYFIKGDNEQPIVQLIRGEDPYTIPNLVGQGFENTTTYTISQGEYNNLSYDLSWFPEYQKQWDTFPCPDQDFIVDFSRIPLRPRYWSKKGEKNIKNIYRIPSSGGRYHLPQIFTSRGPCPAVHKGCEHCVGSQKTFLVSTYKRGTLTLDNDTVISHIKQIANKSPQITLYITSPEIYDFRGHYFDIDATIEIDRKTTPEEIANILPSFRKATAHIGLYEEGLIGNSIKQNVEEYFSYEDENHKVYFFAYMKDWLKVSIPKNKMLHSEGILPKWTHWEYYTNFSQAMKISRMWFIYFRQYNLFPSLMRPFLAMGTAVLLRSILLLKKLGIIKIPF